MYQVKTVAHVKLREWIDSGFCGNPQAAPPGNRSCLSSSLTEFPRSWKRIRTLRWQDSLVTFLDSQLAQFHTSLKESDRLHECHNVSHLSQSVCRETEELRNRLAPDPKICGVLNLNVEDVEVYFKWCLTMVLQRWWANRCKFSVTQRDSTWKDHQMDQVWSSLMKSDQVFKTSNSHLWAL